MKLIVKNAIACGICQAGADRYDILYQCQANPNHVGDLYVGIFTDLTHPDDRTPNNTSTQALGENDG